MSPKRQVNHNIRKHFNTIIYNISRYAEIALSMVILLVIALAGFRLIMELQILLLCPWIQNFSALSFLRLCLW